MIRTLVVDDDFMSASIHRTYIDKITGFEAVGEAHSGGEALELILRLRPDLVLLDIYLPDMSGLDVLRRLRQDEAGTTDVIAVTAAKDVKTLRAAMQGGVVHYVASRSCLRPSVIAWNGTPPSSRDSKGCRRRARVRSTISSRSCESREVRGCRRGSRRRRSGSSSRPPANPRPR